jgi:hypothetical protein
LSSRPGAGKVLLLAVCLGLGLAQAAFPRGAAEKADRTRLAQAEQLIEERKYNQAILALHDLLQQNPELFDEAEKLMQRIREARAEYNAKFDELIKALFEENNVPKGLALIAELEALDPYPNEAVARALEQAKVGREMVVNMNRFNRIMDEAAGLLAQGRYLEADQRYLTGFELGRESFDAADYGNILKNSVLASLQSVQAATQALPAALAGLQAAEKTVQTALPPAPLSLPALEAGIGQAAGAARELSGLQEAARAAGENFAAQGRQIGERPAGRGYDSFLFFGAQLILGRSGKPREGIAAVFAAARETAVARQKQALLGAADELWKQGLADYESGLYPLDRLAAASSLYEAGLRLVSLWTLDLQSPLSRSAPASVGQQIAEYLRLRERIRAAKGYEELAQVSRAFAPLAQAGVPPSERIAAAHQELAGLRQRAAGVEQSSGAAAEGLRRQEQAAGLSLGEAVEEDLALQRAAGALRGRLEGLDLQLLAALAGGTAERLAGRLSDYQARYQEGLGLQQGVQTPERLEKYPDRALALFNRLTSETGAAAQEAGGLAEEIAAEPGYLDRSPQLREISQSLSGSRDTLIGLQAQIAAAAASAQAQSLQAGRYRQEGVLRQQEVQRNLNPLREPQARESLRLAQEAYDRSLEFQEDPEVRRRRDEELPQLAARIDEAVNERVIREVRALIESGRNKYTHGDYAGAEQDLVRADARWKDTHPETNPEVKQWLDWTRLAIQSISGREIDYRDPLYKDMTQLYNLAYQGYQSGKRLVEQGRQQEAIALLNEAVNRLNQIKISFPYNSEAQTLLLRIEQLRDPGRFRDVLDAQFRDALSKRRDNPSEALNTLEVIRKLSPNYPGLAKAISELRPSLGIERPPPTEEQKKEARRLYAEALRTYQQNQRVLFPRALEQLNTAIILDPDYREAAALKDTLQVALGASRQAFLSSDDQRRFREAEGYFLNGQYPSAYQIVIDLLRNQRNRNYPPLLDLRDKIEARL